MVERGVATELEPLTVDAQRAETILHGEIADQAALHGVLDVLLEHGLQLLEVRRLPEPAGSTVPSSGRQW